MTANRCPATKTNGQPCTLPASSGYGGLCRYHSPDRIPKPANESAGLPLRQLHPRGDRYWQTVPAPLPAAEVSRLRRAVGIAEEGTA